VIAKMASPKTTSKAANQIQNLALRIMLVACIQC
jgi:hypothetical protein